MLNDFEIREKFDENFVLWSKAVVLYGKERVMSNSAIQLVLESYRKESEP